MKWSKSNQRMAERLQSIERARKSAAELRLASAREGAVEAEERAGDARKDAQRAEQDWADHLRNGQFDVELQRALSRDVLWKEQELGAREQRRSDAEAEFDRQRHEWQHLEAGVQAANEVLRRGRRFLLRRSNDSQDHETSLQTTWKWFRR